MADHRWDFLLGDDVVRRMVDAATYRRGAEYALRGRVERVSTSTGGIVLATVRGSGSRLHQVVVTLRGGRPTGQCTCPVDGNCKHVVAALLAAQRRLTTSAADLDPTLSATDADSGGWERAVAGLAAPDEPAGAGRASRPETPLALQFEVEPPRPVSNRFGATRHPRPGSPHRLRVRVRPMAWGRSQRWIRTGAAWEDLADLARRAPDLLGDHGHALARMYGLVQPAPAPPHRRARWGARAWVAERERPVYLDEFGRRVWAYLRELADLELPFVLADPDHPDGCIALAPGSANVTLDLRRDPAQGAARLYPRVLVGGQPAAPGPVHLVGEPASGLLLRPEPGAPGGDEHATVLLAPLDRPPSRQLADLLDAGEPIRIPDGDLDRFLRVYYRSLRKVVPVESTDGSVDLPEIVPPTLVLTATFEPGHAVTLDWAFGYRSGDRSDRVPLDRLVSAHAHLAAVGTATDGPVVRDHLAERDLLRRVRLPADRLPQLCTSAPSSSRRARPTRPASNRPASNRPGPNGAADTMPAPHVRLTGLDTAVFVEHVLPVLQADENVVVEVHGNPADYRESDAVPQIEVTADDAADGDWFDLGVTVSLDGEHIPFEPLFTALARGESELLLDSGTYFRIDRPEFDRLRTLIEEARALRDRPGSGLQVSVYQAGLWDELRTLGVVARQSERWRATVAGLLDVEQAAAPPVPTTFTAQLRPYQLDGYRWLAFLHEHGLGGVLADDMGLGKTVQVLALLCRAAQRAPDGPPFLVVAPTSVVANWAHEARRFAPDLPVCTVEQTAARRRNTLADHVARARLVITSYSLFRLEYDAYATLPWAGLILDEAQFVKNHQGKTHQCVRRLPAPFKLAVTGTPMENNLMELWALLSVTAPGLFPDPDRFAATYVKPAGKDQPSPLGTLHQRIRPLMLRRTKEQVANDLPAKQEQVVEVGLSPQHQRIYQTHLQRERQKVLGLIDDMNSNRFAIFRSLTLLRQLCLDPVLVDDGYAGVGSRKVDVLLERLGEVVGEGHRALVFSQFTGFLRTVRARLDDQGVSYCYLDGRTANRSKVIEEFKSGDAAVFLISLKAGGFGLNLTEADYCFVLDPWWNPAVEAQAVDRTHRIGQRKKVMVYRLVSADTIEEKVMQLKARKLELFRQVIDSDGDLTGSLSAEDIRALLASPR